MSAEQSQAPLRGNLFAVDTPQEGERFTALAQVGPVMIERIISSATPGVEPYDQAHDEWVVLLRGSATLEIAGEISELKAGDYVLLPAHTLHRVLETSAGALWLAVHVAHADRS